MCGHGDTCHECHRPAILEIFWASWAGRYCDSHGKLLLMESPGVVLVIKLKESEPQ